MGDRYYLTVMCTQCGAKHVEVYYAPTCNIDTFRCVCGSLIDLEQYSGISYEDASNKTEIETLAAAQDNAGEQGEG